LQVPPPAVNSLLSAFLVFPWIQATVLFVIDGLRSTCRLKYLLLL